MYLVIDTETGGLTTDYSLLSVAGIILDDELNKLADFHCYTRPESPADYACTGEALAVNGFNLSLHYDNANSYPDTEFYIGSLLARYATLFTPIGWNVDFDIDFIGAYLPVVARSLSYRKLDVCSVARFINLKTKTTAGSLVDWARHFGMDTSNAHDALEDCYLTLGVLKGFLEL